MKLSRYLFAVLFCFLAIDWAQGQSNKTAEALLKARAELHEGDLKANKDRLMKARSLMESLAQDKNVAALAHYYAGFARWRLSAMLSGEESLKELENAVEPLKNAIKLDPDFADAYALLHTCVAQQPKLRPLPEYRGLLERAVQLAPKNPRVMLFQAMSLFFKPEQYGGNKEQGIRIWQEAARLSEQESNQDSLLPNWGRAEIHGWMGGAFLVMNEPQKAKEAFVKALAVYPDFWWVKDVALPRAESQMRDKK